MKILRLFFGLSLLLVAHLAISQTAAPGMSGPPPITSDQPKPSSELPISGGALLPDDSREAKPQGELVSGGFVADATQAGMFEVAAGKLALSKATKKEIREFAQRMVTDHGSANAKLAAIAAKINFDIPKTLDAKHTEKLAMLKTKSGAAFDQAYISEMKSGHDQAMALFTAGTTSKSVSTPLRDFASTTLPVIREHHKMVMTFR